MGVRLPLQTVLDYTATNDLGAGSVAGGVPLTFTMPQDADALVVKLIPSTVGGGVSALLQTSDDGGTTWYDVSRTSIASNSALPVFSSGFVNAGGMATAINATPANSILTVGISNTNASTLSAQQISGLPLLSPLNRVFLIYTGNLTGNSSRVQVKVNSQSQGA